MLHYDSGVDNDEKEGDSRTKQDVYEMLERRCSRTDGERLGFFSH